MSWNLLPQRWVKFGFLGVFFTPSKPGLAWKSVRARRKNSSGVFFRMGIISVPNLMLIPGLEMGGKKQTPSSHCPGHPQKSINNH